MAALEPAGEALEDPSQAALGLLGQELSEIGVVVELGLGGVVCPYLVHGLLDLVETGDGGGWVGWRVPESLEDVLGEVS